MIKRIKYVSHFARPFSPAEIDAIAVDCESSYMELGVTGVLMISGGIFFQILEGPEKVVDELYEQICKDPCHKDVLLLNAENNVQRRLFPDWAMKTISLEASREERLAPLHALLETVVAQRKMIDKLLHTIERSVWQELAHSTARTEAAIRVAV